MTQRDPVVRIDKLSYQYPGSAHLALRDISLSVRKGEFVGIIGPTGAGKTTLCLALNGIVPQFFGGRFFGHVVVAGLDTLDNPIHLLAQHVAMVFQDPETQLVTNSVEDEVAFALENVRVPRETMRQRIAWALRTVRLVGMERKHPSELSGGEKQRLAVAAALALQPQILVLDEPTSQLDPLGTQEVFATVRELNTKLGITVILASHANEELAEFVDRVALLANGQLVDIGAPSRIFAQVDVLRRYSVRPPQVASLFAQLQNKGIEAPTIPVTLETAVQTYEAVRSRIELQPSALPAEGIDEADPAARAGRTSPVLLSAKNLEYAYPDGTRALCGVSLDVREGEYAAILGQNGAGKTTLLKLFLGLLQPSAGQVLLDGRDVRDLHVSDIARRIGFVAQNPDNQIFSSTVEAEVAFALRNLGLDRTELDERVEESLRAMGLLSYRGCHPLALPKGDRARVVIAAVLAMRPDALILDEPTTGQDYAGAKRILDLSRQLHQTGKTVIVVTHHLYLIGGFAQRAVVMGKGSVVLDAPLRQAMHEARLLRSTCLAPPQIVQLAQLIAAREQVALPILTPEELALCMAPRKERG